MGTRGRWSAADDRIYATGEKDCRSSVQRKKQTLTLLVRVPSNVKACDAIGIDVCSWIKEGLVDALIPTTRGYLNMSRNISEMVEIAGSSKCEIYGGLSDLYVRHYRGPAAPRASIEMLRGAAQLH